MERVETLCNRLLEQIAQNASPDTLLVTVQMLQSELLHLKATTAPIEEAPAAVAIDMPVAFENAEITYELQYTIKRTNKKNKIRKKRKAIFSRKNCISALFTALFSRQTGTFWHCT